MEATALSFSALAAAALPRTSASSRRLGFCARRRGAAVAAKMDGGGKGVPTTNYVVPLDKAPGMTRPLVEILRDLNKRVPDKIIDPETNTVPWYHANRMLSFYAPVDWWTAFDRCAIEVAKFAKRILGLCCSSSECERNWSTFEFIHTKKRNRLEHQRLSDLVYIQYNRRIVSRFQKRCELGRNFDPLILEDANWENEWVVNEPEVVNSGEDLTWRDVDLALGSSIAAENRTNPRRGQASSGPSSTNVYARHGAPSLRIIGLGGEDSNSDNEVREDDFPNDDEDVTDDYGETVPPLCRCTDESY